MATLKSKQTTGTDAATYTASLEEEVKQLKAKLEAKRNQPLSMKISAKRALSVYGLGRFPVTLYAAQWQRLNEFMPSLTQAIMEHKEELAWKED